MKKSRQTFPNIAKHAWAHLRFHVPFFLFLFLALTTVPKFKQRFRIHRNAGIAWNHKPCLGTPGGGWILKGLQVLRRLTENNSGEK